MNSKARLAVIGAVFVVLLGVIFAIVGLATKDKAQQAKAQQATAGPTLVQPYPSAPKCADVFVVGKTLNLVGDSFACLNPDGRVEVLGGWRCNDGRHLWSAKQSTGAKDPGWGFAGEPFQKAESNNIGADAGYGQAYERCHM